MANFKLWCDYFIVRKNVEMVFLWSNIPRIWCCVMKLACLHWIRPRVDPKHLYTNDNRHVPHSPMHLLHPFFHKTFVLSWCHARAIQCGCIQFLWHSSLMPRIIIFQFRSIDANRSPENFSHKLFFRPKKTYVNIIWIRLLMADWTLCWIQFNNIRNEKIIIH